MPWNWQDRKFPLAKLPLTSLSLSLIHIFGSHLRFILCDPACLPVLCIPAAEQDHGSREAVCFRQSGVRDSRQHRGRDGISLCFSELHVISASGYGRLSEKIRGKCLPRFPLAVNFHQGLCRGYGGRNNPAGNAGKIFRCV